MKLCPLRSRTDAVSVAVAGALLLAARFGTAGEPAGIYALLPSYNSARTVPLDGLALWNNVAIQGITARTVWSKVEPVQGDADWSFFDDALRVAAAHGKQVGLSLAAGLYAPAWVYAAGARRFNFTVTGPWQTPTASTMPEPWDPAFQREWGKVVSAMGARYDANPDVAYVMVGGVGYDIESFFVKTPADAARLAALGGPESWLQGAKQVVDLYAAAFPHKTVVLAMESPLGGPAGVPWLRRLVEYGMRKYPGQFGVMYDGLTATADERTYENAAVSKYSSASATGFQMIWSSEGEEGQERLKGSLSQALDRAVELKAHWVEVYEADCENPDYQDKLKESNQELLQTAAAQ